VIHEFGRLLAGAQWSKLGIRQICALLLGALLRDAPGQHERLLDQIEQRG
jgi:hypothetical protein